MLIDTLITIQIRAGLTDQDFAESIGISRGSWNRIKNRRAPFGRKFLSAVRKAYPELKDTIDIFLSGSVPADIEGVVTVTTPTEGPQNKILGLFGALGHVLTPLLRRIKAKQALKSKSSGVEDGK